MRRRRADRCLLRACAALDADVPEIAEQLVEEARALDPHHPELHDITERLLAAFDVAAAAAAAARPSPTTAPPVSPGLVVLLVIALTLMWAAAVMESDDLRVVVEHLLTAAGSASLYVLPSV